MTDRFGNRIEIGSIITYPGRRSSSIWMTDAIVLKVIENTGELLVQPVQENRNDTLGNPWKYSTQRKTWIKRSGRATVLPHLKTSYMPKIDFYTIQNPEAVNA